MLGPSNPSTAAPLVSEAAYQLTAAFSEMHPTVSIGTTRRGTLIFARRFESGPHTHVRNPEASWGLPRLIDIIKGVAEKIRTEHPGCEKIVVGDLSRRNGGRFRPHYTHQQGRDIDLRYFLTGGTLGDYAYRPVTHQNFDKKRNLALLDALQASPEVDRVLMDHRHQKLLWKYARAEGRSAEELSTLLSYPRGRAVGGALVHHARGHWNHIHIRIRPGHEAQLGRRWNRQKALKLQRKYNTFLRTVREHLVMPGDTFDLIARRYRVKMNTLMDLNAQRASQPLLPGDVIKVRP